MNPRIEELRRRVQREPASIAFAQLAEEYRRAGDNAEAEQVCRAGLARYPSYLSARVTLGRALIALNRENEARRELEDVLRVAPDHLAATHALGEISAPGGGPGQLLDNPLNHFPIEQHSEHQALHAVVPAAHHAPPPCASEPREPVLANLEAWLGAIDADRRCRRLTT